MELGPGRGGGERTHVELRLELLEALLHELLWALQVLLCLLRGLGVHVHGVRPAEVGCCDGDALGSLVSHGGRLRMGPMGGVRSEG